MVNQRHAPFLLIAYKEATAAAKAVTVMFTRHTITPICRAKHVARQFTQRSSMLWYDFFGNFSRFFRNFALKKSFSPSLSLFFGPFLPFNSSFVFNLSQKGYWIESTRTVISDEHRYTPMVAISKHLRATSAATISIKGADLVVTEVKSTHFFAVVRIRF